MGRDRGIGTWGLGGDFGRRISWLICDLLFGTGTIMDGCIDGWALWIGRCFSIWHMEYSNRMSIAVIDVS